MQLAQRQHIMALRAIAFLNTLTPEQHQHTVFPFSSSERFNWDYRPRQRQGLPFKEMTAEQRAAAFALLQFSLSEVGYQKAHNIMQIAFSTSTTPNSKLSLDRFVFSCREQRKYT